MSCGGIDRQSCGSGGGIKRLGCCFVPWYGPFSDGLDIYGRDIGPNWTGQLFGGGNGGGGNHWDGDAGFGGGGDDIGDDPGDNWYDGDASFGGGGDTIGDDDDPPNCLAYGTEVTLFSGVNVPIETLRVDDQLASIVLDKLHRDADDGQYHLHEKQIGREVAPGRVASIRHGWHHGSFRINGRTVATFEHPFLIRRGAYFGFSPAESLREGDMMITRLGEEEITSIVRAEAPVRTVSLSVPHLNTFMASGLWVHNANYKSPPIVGGVGSGDDPGGKSSGGWGSF